MKIINCEQYSDIWWAAKLGCPSASNAKKLVTSTAAPSKQLGAYAISLANNLFAGKDVDAIDPTAWMLRGTETESEARSAYELVRGVDVEEVGMFTDDLGHYLASPDGVVGDGLLEIKVLKPVNHTKAILEYKKTKKAPTDYYAQIQMQLFVSEKSWADLLLYNDSLPMQIIRVEPDQKMFDALKTQLAMCIAERDLVLDELRSF